MVASIKKLRKKLKKNDVVAYVKKLSNGNFSFVEKKIKSVLNGKVKIENGNTEKEFNDDGTKTGSTQEESLEPIPGWLSLGLKASSFVKNASNVSSIELNEIALKNLRESS